MPLLSGLCMVITYSVTSFQTCSEHSLKYGLQRTVLLECQFKYEITKSVAKLIVRRERGCHSFKVFGTIASAETDGIRRKIRRW